MARTRTYKPKFGYDIRIKPDAPRKPVEARKCDMPGCPAGAEIRTPRSRSNLADRQWLCREHARIHNERWDYFAGMDEAEIERFRDEALTGHRPTWPLGRRAAGERNGNVKGPWSYRFEDGFAIFEEVAEPGARARPAMRVLTTQQAASLNVLALDENATLHEVKARYKELVKRYHPDANGGDRGAEERLKQVIKAYGHLRATGLA